MKKITISLLLTLALVGAAVAAPVELKGQLGTEIEYKPGEDLVGSTFLAVGLEGQVGKNVKGVFGYRLHDGNGKTLFDWNKTNNIDFNQNGFAYVESIGALWAGAQPVKMNMGALDINYSPYIATFGYNTKQFTTDEDWNYFYRNGFSFDQIKLGTIDTRLFYAFDKTDDEDDTNSFGVNFKGAFDDIDLDATLVKKGDPVAYDINAALSPVAGLTLAGHFLSDGAEDEGWYKFQVGYQGIPNWRFAATYRDFTPELDLPYRDTTPSVVGGQFVMPNPYDLNQGREGLILNASTNYAGYDLAGEYDYAYRTTQFVASKANCSAKLKLFYEEEDNSFNNEEVKSLLVLRGNTTSDVALLKNVKFEGVAEFGDDAVFGGSAEYVAPNGLNLTAEYYTGDLRDDNRYGWTQEEGLTVRAGYFLTF